MTQINDPLAIPQALQCLSKSKWGDESTETDEVDRSSMFFIFPFEKLIEMRPDTVLPTPLRGSKVTSERKQKILGIFARTKGE